MSWDDDPHSFHGLDLLSDAVPDSDLDPGERTTRVPSIPMAELVAASMAESDRREQAEAKAEAASNRSLPRPAALPTESERNRPISGLPPLEHTLGGRYVPSFARSENEIPTVAGQASPVAPSQGPGSTQPAPARDLREFAAPPAARPPRDTDSFPTSAVAVREEAARLRPPSEQPPTVGQADQEPPASVPPRSRLSSAPPLTSRSMAGPVGPPSTRPPASLRSNSEAPLTTRSEIDQSRRDMKDKYATGDFSGALELADQLLAADPGDLEASRFANSCRDVLTQMLLSRLGRLDQIVELALPPEEMRWLSLDHRAGFLLSLIDGALSIEELLDITGMPKLESLRILASLIDQRVLRLTPA